MALGQRSCKWCKGTGFIGLNANTGKVLVCVCVPVLSHDTDQARRNGLDKLIDDLRDKEK